MPRKKAFALVLAIFMTVSVPLPFADAQISDPLMAGALAIIGPMTVGKILDQIQQMIENVGAIANNDFNLDYGNAFITLQAGMQGVWNSLDDERTKIVNDLDSQRKNAIADVYVLAQDMIKKQIPFQQAKLKVDTLTVLNHVGLLGKQTRFMIAHIDPTVITYKDTGDYAVTILGIGIGNQEGKQVPTTITLIPPNAASHTIKPENIVDGVKFTIPRTLVASKFALSNFYRMKVVIASKVPQACGFLKIRTCIQPYSFDYSLTLFPRVAVSAVVNQFRTTPTTDPSTRIAKNTSVTTPNGDGHPGQNWATPVIVADLGYQILKVDLQKCENTWVKPGDPCQFVRVSFAGPQNLGDSAQASGQNDSWPVTLYFAMWEEKKSTVSVPLPPFPVSFAAGESKTVQVMSDAVSVLMNMTTATGNQSLIPLVPPGGSALDAVVCTDRSEIGSGIAQYVCKAKSVDFY